MNDPALSKKWYRKARELGFQVAPDEWYEWTFGTFAALGTCAVAGDLGGPVFRVAPAAVARTCRGARLYLCGRRRPQHGTGVC